MNTELKRTLDNSKDVMAMQEEANRPAVEIHAHILHLAINRGRGTDLPAIMIVNKNDPDKALFCRQIRIKGSSTMVHGDSKNKSLAGVTVWIETSSEVEYSMSRDASGGLGWKKISKDSPWEEREAHDNELHVTYNTRCL